MGARRRRRRAAPPNPSILLPDRCCGVPFLNQALPPLTFSLPALSGPMRSPCAGIARPHGLRAGYAYKPMEAPVLLLGRTK